MTISDQLCCTHALVSAAYASELNTSIVITSDAIKFLTDKLSAIASRGRPNKINWTAYMTLNIILHCCHTRKLKCAVKNSRTLLKFEFRFKVKTRASLDFWKEISFAKCPTFWTPSCVMPKIGAIISCNGRHFVVLPKVNAITSRCCRPSYYHTKNPHDHLV